MRYDRTYGRYDSGYNRANPNRSPSQDYALDYGERVRFTAGRGAPVRQQRPAAYDQRPNPRAARAPRYNSGGNSAGRFPTGNRMPGAGGSIYGGSTYGLPRYYSGVGIGMGVGGRGYTPYW
jgi:hypothetical protein